VTFYTVFTIELCSRRVRILGTTSTPDEAFMVQIVRNLTSELDGPRILFCDRDRKWSRAVRQRLEDAGIQVVQTPFRAPNANAYAERFVRSIKEECLNRIIPFGERHFRYALREFLVHYHHERNHQGVGNALIEPVTHAYGSGAVRRRKRLAGLLSYYHRAA
jgi:transposase InsO family protein